jgi:hypothetical protein
MKAKLYNEINTLLSQLHSYRVVEKVNAYYYLLHGNSAPAEELKNSIGVIEKRLSKQFKDNK